MSINELLTAVNDRAEAKAACDRAMAEEKIAQTSETEAAYKKWFPSLFEGEYPIKKMGGD